MLRVDLYFLIRLYAVWTRVYLLYVIKYIKLENSQNLLIRIPTNNLMVPTNNNNNMMNNISHSLTLSFTP